MERKDWNKLKKKIRKKLSAIKKRIRVGWQRFRLGFSHLPSVKNPVLIDLSEGVSVYSRFASDLKNQNISLPPEATNDFYFTKPLNDKQIVMFGLGYHVRGNLQYLLQVLNTADEFKDFKIFVRTAQKSDEQVKQFIRDNHWERTYAVLSTPEYEEVMETSKYLITEISFPDSWVKRPGQVYINIWHGTPLKCIGLSKNYQNAYSNGKAQKNFICADYLCYPNDYTKQTLLASYKVSGLMQGETIMLGYPRTGGMLATDQEKVNEIRMKLAPNNEQLYIYMPTFRDGKSQMEGIAMIKNLLDELEQMFSEDQVLYVNLHPNVNSAIDYSVYHKIRPFPTDMDTYQLMAASDALLTDYSSVMFDYLALRRQIVLYIPDYQSYRERRGLNMDLQELPFDKAMTPLEVMEALNRGKQYDDSLAYKQFCSYDSPNSAKKVCRLFLGDTTDLISEKIPKEGIPAILVYSSTMPKRKSTKLLYEFTQIRSKKAYDLYLSCDMNKVKPGESSAYPMCSKNPVIGTVSNPYLSSVGQAIKNLYLHGEISFEKAMEELKYEYALKFQKQYGQAHFDLVLIYEYDEPEQVLALTCSGSDLFLFLQHETVIQLGNDKFLSDVIQYAAGYSRCIFTTSEDDQMHVISFLGSEETKHVIVLSSAVQMDVYIKKELKV